MIPVELDRKTVNAWRAFAATAEFEDGIKWLEAHHAPRINKTSMPEMTESTIGRAHYLTALDDVKDRLTNISKPEKDAEEPLLER